MIIIEIKIIGSNCSNGRRLLKLITKVKNINKFDVNINELNKVSDKKKYNVNMIPAIVVDDAAFMRMMVKDILTKGGYNVVGEAENGVVAVQKYAELKPDLVTLDITMPEMDGIQALKKIKEVDAGANVIMCSAMGQQAMVIEAIQNGAKDFIVKPFQADRVLEAVKKVIG